MFRAVSVIPARQVAAAGQQDASLFAALATAAERHMRDFNPQNLVNTAWAFATLRQKDALLFAALTTAAERCMGDLSPQELANTSWAFASAGQN